MKDTDFFIWKDDIRILDVKISGHIDERQKI